MRVLYYVLLFLVSASEFVICYYLLFHTALGEERLSVFDKGIVLGSVILPSVLLTMNRSITFFSDSAFFVAMVIFCAAVCWLSRNKIIFLCAYIWLYYTMVALLDLCLAFAGMAIVRNSFYELIYWQTTSLWQIAVYAVSRAVILGIVYYIIKKKWRGDEGYTSCFILINAALFLVLKRYQIRMDEMALGESEMNGADNVLSLFTIVLVIALIMVLFLKNQIMQEEKRYLELHDQMTEQSYRLLLQNDEMNHRLVHDVKHHLLLLRKMARENDIERIGRYLDEIEKEYSETENLVWTGNRFLDFILNQKKQRAEDKGIRVVINSEIIPEWNLTENEISILFGNLLDNAVEACEKMNSLDRWIEVSIKKRASILIIAIGNSIEKSPVMHHNRIISDKRNPQLHGYGLKSISRIVEQQEGCINWRVQKHEFYIDITFFNSDKRKEGEA